MKASQFCQFFSWCGIERGVKLMEKNGLSCICNFVSAQDDRTKG